MSMSGNATCGFFQEGKCSGQATAVDAISTYQMLWWRAMIDSEASGANCQVLIYIELKREGGV
jgi:hypothetical protein